MWIHSLEDLLSASKILSNDPYLFSRGVSPYKRPVREAKILKIEGWEGERGAYRASIDRKILLVYKLKKFS